VPKTNGELRMFIEDTNKGLFVTGFKSGSLALEQGILRAQDEILAADNFDAKGRHIDEFVHFLSEHKGDVIAMTVKRAGSSSKATGPSTGTNTATTPTVANDDIEVVFDGWPSFRRTQEHLKSIQLGPPSTLLILSLPLNQMTLLITSLFSIRWSSPLTSR
jgi:hypothetical protein